MRLICILAWAGAICACGDSSNRTRGTGGDGGTSGTGDGDCTGVADIAVYETAGAGDFQTGVCSVADALANCVTGADGCLEETLAVVGADGQDAMLNETLAVCVEECTGDAFALSPNCLSCYGGTVTCSAATCAAPCAPAPLGEACNTCRRESGCLADFVDCSRVGCDPFAEM